MTSMMAVLLVLCAAPLVLVVDSIGADEAAIRQVNREEVEGFLRRDPDLLDRLWSSDLIVTNPLNQLVTKDDVLRMIRSGFLVITSYDRQIEYVHAYGKMMIVAGHETVVWGGTMPLAGKAQHLRFTAVWLLRDGHWEEIARHANIVATSRPGQ